MKNSKRMLLLLLVLTLSLSMVLTACGGKKTPEGTTDLDGTKEEGKEEGKEDSGNKVLRLAGMPISTLNPHQSSMESDTIAQEYIYGQLLQLVYDKDTKAVDFVGYHAEGLPEVNEENTVWTFTVKDGMKWQDGTAITAEDYVYSWKMLLDPKLANRNAMVLVDNLKIKNANAYYKGEIDNFEEVGIKVVDGNKIEVTMEVPTPEIDVYSNFAEVAAAPIHKNYMKQV